MESSSEPYHARCAVLPARSGVDTGRPLRGDSFHRASRALATRRAQRAAHQNAKERPCESRTQLSPPPPCLRGPGACGSSDHGGDRGRARRLRGREHGALRVPDRVRRKRFLQGQDVLRRRGEPGADHPHELQGQVHRNGDGQWEDALYQLPARRHQVRGGPQAGAGAPKRVQGPRSRGGPSRRRAHGD